MGELFVKRTTAWLLLIVAALSLVCVALLILILAPDGSQDQQDGVDGRTDYAHTATSSATNYAHSATPNAPDTTNNEETSSAGLLKEAWEKDYRIPEWTVPHHYDLYLHPNLETGTFEGRVGILVGVTQLTPHLLSHIKALNVTSTRVIEAATGVQLPLLDAFEYRPNQFWVVRPKDPLTPGNYTLYLEFHGLLTGKIVGFYKSVYTTKAGEKRAIATSKFQPTDARQAFPCFDEPSFKSTYNTTLVRPSQGYIALSNMPVQREVPDAPAKGLTEVVFDKSVPMVTYLACFIVCDFQYKEIKTKANKTFRVYATSDQLDRVDYARDIGVDTLNFFEEYFGIDYPLPKQDMIAIPDFSSGAMEHWGLITFRETALLYDDKGSSSQNKQRVAAVVSHELAHMWFGNLVTVKWWNDLWLNEGFASYIEYKGMANYEKQWEMEGQFLIDDLQVVMVLDELLTSHPIVQPVNHPDEITEIFDKISYSKGASVLRMLEDFMGPEEFRKGVSNFLQRFKFGNAVTNDLWNEMEKVLSQSVNISSIMDTWTLQMGFPVVSVITSPEDESQFEVRQKRFLANPEAVSNNDSSFQYRWDIPITYMTDASPKQQVWLYRNMEKVLLPKTPGMKWIKVNVGQYGYYRVNYEPSIWLDLTKILALDHQVISATDRSNLLDDAFSLANAEQIPYDTALSLAGYLANENHYIPWKTVSSHLTKMALLLRNTPAYPLFRKYMVSLLDAHVKLLGWQDTGSHLERLNRPNLLNLACSSGHEMCLNGARERLQSWIADPNIFIPPNLRSLVYTYGIQKSDNSEWDVLLNRYIEEVNAQEKGKMRSGLAFTMEDWIVKRWLFLAENETLIRSQDYFSVLNEVAQRPWNTHIVWNLIKGHWGDLVQRFTLSNRYLGNMVKYVATRFTEKHQLDDLEQFFADHPQAGAGARARLQALEKVRANIKWIEKHASNLEQWFLKREQTVP